MSKPKSVVSKSSKKSSAKEEFLAQSVWAQADGLLARALTDSNRLCRRLDKLSRARRATVENSLHILEAEALLIRQSVAETAALRGLSTFGVAGEVCPFDPVRHELNGRVRSNGGVTAVKIRSPGVVSGSGPNQRVLIRAEATPAPIKVKADAK